MIFENLKKLKNEEFYRYFGIKRFHFNEMLEKLIEIEKLEKTKGRKNKLSVEERLMMTLLYWKEYYTFFQMSIKSKMSPSSCFRNITWVENKLSNHKDYQFLKERYKLKIDKKQENSNLEFSEKTIIIGDLGYQGIQNIYKNTIIPIKRTKNKKLTKQERKYNKIVSKIRIKVEHVFAWLKRFKILVNKWWLALNGGWPLITGPFLI
ncbi:transposase family protein [Spiroplasma endosymbiont of Villa modesta]|uniref:transposase family protein n=1 Tax=Spiroplasma endosymbiont of Villa modesta TaxID=3066293 RepID=UPI00313DC8DE